MDPPATLMVHVESKLVPPSRTVTAYVPDWSPGSAGAPRAVVDRPTATMRSTSRERTRQPETLPIGGAYRLGYPGDPSGVGSPMRCRACPDRPNCAVSRTYRTHLDERVFAMVLPPSILEARAHESVEAFHTCAGGDRLHNSLRSTGLSGDARPPLFGRARCAAVSSAMGLSPIRCQDPLSAARNSGSPETTCARVDSNHHGALAPQGPQPRTRPPDAYRSVRIVQTARFCGRIGHIWSGESCHDVATAARSVWPAICSSGRCRRIASWGGLTSQQAHRRRRSEEKAARSRPGREERMFHDVATTGVPKASNVHSRASDRARSRTTYPVVPTRVRP
jgi:hypothetical protein